MHPFQLALIEKYFPELITHELEENNDGLVNDVIIINHERVFRFPKTESGQRALLNEIKIIGLLKPRSLLQLPDFDIAIPEMVSYKLIPGETLLRNDILRLPETDQDHLVEQLGSFLQYMHRIPMRELSRAQIPASPAQHSRTEWTRLYADVQKDLYPLMMAHARCWVRELFEPWINDETFWHYDPCLINGDIGCYHILFDKNKRRINGIIDFGTAGLGDPAGDYACLLYYYGESFLNRMSRYDPDIEPALNRTRFWAGCLELEWLLGGLKSNDPSWFAVHIGSARDVGVIKATGLNPATRPHGADGGSQCCRPPPGPH